MYAACLLLEGAYVGVTLMDREKGASQGKKQFIYLAKNALASFLRDVLQDIPYNLTLTNLI